jgi:RND superfamily putative drug exporter
MLAAMDTAGRAVIFAGITVVISLLGMLLMGIPLVAGVGLGASVTVLLTMISSLTLLPALIALAQQRIEVTRWRGLIAAGLSPSPCSGPASGSRPSPPAARSSRRRRCW